MLWGEVFAGAQVPHFIAVERNTTWVWTCDPRRWLDSLKAFLAIQFRPPINRVDSQLQQRLQITPGFPAMSVKCEP